WRYLVLPAVTLASVTTALLARMTRGSMLEVLRADYMRTARSKGLREREVVVKHGLRNAMLPVITLVGIDFGTAIGAAVLTGLTLVVVLAYTLVNLIVDLSYAWFDPRIRLGQEAD